MTWGYRGLEIHHEYPPIPIRQFDYIATDPNGEGEMLAHGRSVEECQRDIDRYLEELDDG